MRGTQEERDCNKLESQIINMLKSYNSFGESRAVAKREHTDKSKIFSCKTYEIYKRECLRLARWAEKKYQCTTLEEAHLHVEEYIQGLNKDDTLSTYTVKTAACAIAKLYQESSTTYGPTRSRYRENITRSRYPVDNDKNFSAKNHKELINFCLGTGLRRSELEALRGTALNADETIKVKGKGGKKRNVTIVGEHRADIIKRMSEAKGEKVWGKVSKAMDVHFYRGEYATNFYQSVARKVEDLPKSDRYCCRGDLKGKWYDRKALKIVSKNLGHNRVSVVASHYLYNL